jgi:hypothetical protein
MCICCDLLHITLDRNFVKPCEGPSSKAYSFGLRSAGWGISMTQQVLWMNHSLRRAELGWQEVDYLAICSSETSEHLTTTRTETQKKTIIWSYILYFNSAYFICVLICIVLIMNKMLLICFDTYKIYLEIKPQSYEIKSPGAPDFPYFMISI